MLESRNERNKLRHTIMNAEQRKIITKEEVGFIVTLVERFRSDIEKKIKTLNILQGEISQLKINEQIILDLVSNMIAAAERDVARQETMVKLKESREKDAELKEKRNKEEALKTPTEQVDTVKDKVR